MAFQMCIRDRSVAEYDPKSHVVAPIELLADSVLNEEEKNNG